MGRFFHFHVEMLTKPKGEIKMAVNKTTAEKIELQKIKMEQAQNEIKRLLRQQRTEERRARTHRICERGGMLEGMLPDTIMLSKERFRAFLEKTVASDFGRRTLTALKAEQEKDNTENNEGDIAGSAKKSAMAQGNEDGHCNSSITEVSESTHRRDGEKHTGISGNASLHDSATPVTKATGAAQNAYGLSADKSKAIAQNHGEAVNANTSQRPQGDGAASAAIVPETVQQRT